MRKLLLTTVLMGASIAAFGQGALQWGNANANAFRQVIFGPQTDNSTLSLSGTTSQFFGGSTTGFQDIPNVGTTTYNGLLLTGTRYTFALFAGSTATASNSLSLLGSTTFNTSTTTLNGGNAFPKGYITSATTTVPGVDAGSQARYQVRVWDNQNGTLTSWALAEAAWLAGTTAAGVSQLLTSGGLGGAGPSGPVSTPFTTEITSFNIYYIGSVPEPSIFALAGLGTAGLLIFRRRK